MSAIISDCGTFRYRLERDVAMDGIVFAYFGVNCSTADHRINDHTVNKWIGFTKINGGRRFIVGNMFAYRSQYVADLHRVPDPVGPDNDTHIAQIIADADVLVPCWGPRSKAPKELRYRYDEVEALLHGSGKPVRAFGFSKSGDPLHVLTLSYSTPLVEWRPRVS